jgi:predicted nucleic acid-binding protein
VRYLLDTHIVSDLVRNPEGRVTQRIRKVAEAQLCTSMIVAAELRYGSAKKGSPRLTAQLNAQTMSRMIQLRHVPEDLHRTLKSRAASAGMSLSDYLLAEIRQVAERPTVAELRERLRRRRGVALQVSAADAVRQERDAR